MGKHSGSQSPAPIEQVAPVLLDQHDLARLLGVSVPSVKRWNHCGRLGPQKIKIGRLARWRRDEVLAWVAGGCEPRSKWHWAPGGVA